MEIGGEGPGPHLLHREAFDPELIRAGLLSLGVHVLFALLIFAWSLLDLGSKPSAPPAYVVGLVSPEPGSSVYSVGPLARKAEPKPAPKPVVKATPKPPPPKPKPKPVVKEPPKPKPVAKPKPPPPKPVVKEKPKPAPKPAEKAAPKAVAKAEPKASPAGDKAAASGSSKASTGATTTGVASRSGSAGKPGGQAKSLAYVRYYNELHDTLKAHFVWAGGGDDSLAATVRFSILPDGRITDVRMKAASGNPHYDRAVLSAVLGVVRLTPPPPQHRSEFKEVEWVFRPSDS